MHNEKISEGLSRCVTHAHFMNIIKSYLFLLNGFFYQRNFIHEQIQHLMTITVKPRYNKFDYGDNRFLTIWLNEINYFLNFLTIIWLFRLLLIWWNFLVRIVIIRIFFLIKIFNMTSSPCKKRRAIINLKKTSFEIIILNQPMKSRLKNSSVSGSAKYSIIFFFRQRYQSFFLFGLFI